MKREAAKGRFQAHKVTEEPILNKQEDYSVTPHFNFIHAIQDHQLVRRAIGAM
jgi:hypothetical protein